MPAVMRTTLPFVARSGRLISKHVYELEISEEIG